MDHVALKAELTNDPLTRGYTGMTDAQAATSLMTNNRARKIDLSADRLRTTLMIRSPAIWDKLLDAAASHAQAAVKTAAQGFVDAVRYVGGNWPTSEPAVLTAYTARLDTFVSATPAVLTAGQRTAALALTDSTQTRADELGLGVVSYTDIAIARAL